MARQERQELDSSSFLKIIDGSICAKSSTPQEGYVEFNTTNPTNGQPVQYFVRRYTAVSGKFVSLKRADIPEKHIKGWNLGLRDEAGNFYIFFKEGAITTNRLLKVFENLNLDEEITVKAWKNKEDGKPAIVFEQNGKNVPQKYGKDNLPEPKKRRNGEWDYSAQDDFLLSNMLDNVLPNLPQPEKAMAASATGSPSNGDDDDIPF